MTNPETQLIEAARPVQGRARIFSVRGANVILDEALAPYLGVETRFLNQAVKRNIERFPESWTFQLSAVELTALKAEAPPEKPGRGGRRSLPWAFTEHGVVMAASVLRSPAAIQAMQLVVEVFVEARKRPAESERQAFGSRVGSNVPAHLDIGGDQFAGRLKLAIDRVLDTIVDQKNQATIRQEALSVMSEAIQSMKERLKRSGVENEEIASRATKILAEAEAEKAVAARTRAETDQIEFATLVRKLRLVMSAELLMASGDVRGFLSVLDDLARA